MKLSLIVKSALVLLLTFSAQAEVMDKEPSIELNFTWGIVGAIVVFICARYKPWTLLGSFTLTSFYFYSLISEIQDPHVGSQMLREAGEYYINSAYFLSALPIVSLFIGLYLRVKSQEHNQCRRRDI